jgi:hypothetical protein
MNCLFPEGPHEPDGPDEGQESHRGAMAALVVLIVLVLIGLGLIHALRHTGAVQDCAMQGRTNCAPVQ